MGNLHPEVIRSGFKRYEVRVEKKNSIPTTYFRDSYLFMPEPLCDLVEGYGLQGQVEDKPFFPHLYNRPENYYRRRHTLPKASYYQPDAMKPEKRTKFYAWYKQYHQWLKKTGSYWVLDKVIRDYCNSDVDILVYAMMAFRKEWLEITEDDPFRNCKRGSGSGTRETFLAMTVVSACMRHFRLNHLQTDTLIRSPEHGFERHSRQSVVALKYLKWYQARHKVQVRHRDAPGGEYEFKYTDAQGRSKRFLLDGYVERPGQRPLAIEVYG